MKINFNSINLAVEKVIIRHESELLVDRAKEESRKNPYLIFRYCAEMAGFAFNAVTRLQQISEHGLKPFKRASK